MRNLGNTIQLLCLYFRNGSDFYADEEQMQIQQANLGGYKHTGPLHDTLRGQLNFNLLRL